MKPDATLHYVYDPFCGWCHGASSLVSAAREIDGLKVLPHGGGMLAGPKAQKMSSQWREFVRPHEKRIAELSDALFGEQYREQAQFDGGLLLDSGPPTAAMLAAEQLSERGADILKALQYDYYVLGNHIATAKRILEVAISLGFDRETFKAAFEEALKTLPAHFAETGKLLEDVGGRGYPTLALEVDGRMEVFPLGNFIGKPEAFKSAVEERLASPLN